MANKLITLDDSTTYVGANPATNTGMWERHVYMAPENIGSWGFAASKNNFKRWSGEQQSYVSDRQTHPCVFMTMDYASVYYGSDASYVSWKSPPTGASNEKITTYVHLGFSKDNLIDRFGGFMAMEMDQTFSFYGDNKVYTHIGPYGFMVSEYTGVGFQPAANAIANFSRSRTLNKNATYSPYINGSCESTYSKYVVCERPFSLDYTDLAFSLTDATKWKTKSNIIIDEDFVVEGSVHNYMLCRTELVETWYKHDGTTAVSVIGSKTPDPMLPLPQDFSFSVPYNPPTGAIYVSYAFRVIDITTGLETFVPNAYVALIPPRYVHPWAATTGEMGTAYIPGLMLRLD